LDFSVGACNAWCAACLARPHAELLALHAYDAGRDADKTGTASSEQRALLEQLIRDEAPASAPPCRACSAASAPRPSRRRWTRSSTIGSRTMVLGSRSRGALQQAR
jgi:hypothetical protein